MKQGIEYPPVLVLEIEFCPAVLMRFTMLRFPLWEELPYFYELAKTGSLRRAAENLRISPATLSSSPARWVQTFSRSSISEYV